MKRIALLVVLFIALLPSPALAACNGYTVSRGDTLYRIALANGTTWQALARLNGIANADKIYAGQCIKVGTAANEGTYEQVAIAPAPISTAVVSTAYTRPRATVASGLEGYADLLNTIVDAAFSKCPDLVGELSEVRLDEANTTRPAIVGWYEAGGIAHLTYIAADRVDYVAGVIAHEAAHARQFRTGNFGDNIEIDAMIIASYCR